MMHSQARRYSDTITCAACGCSWDANDPEPPPCVPRPKTPPIKYERKSIMANAQDWKNLREAMESGDFSKLR